MQSPPEASRRSDTAARHPAPHKTRATPDSPCPLLPARPGTQGREPPGPLKESPRGGGDVQAAPPEASGARSSRHGRRRRTVALVVGSVRSESLRSSRGHSSRGASEGPIAAPLDGLRAAVLVEGHAGRGLQRVGILGNMAASRGASVLAFLRLAIPPHACGRRKLDRSTSSWG